MLLKQVIPDEHPCGALERLNDLTIIMRGRSMSEPVMGVGCRPPALRKFALLATALSLLGFAALSAPVTGG
jgi:hypothetical protein